MWNMRINDVDYQARDVSFNAEWFPPSRGSRGKPAYVQATLLMPGGYDIQPDDDLTIEVYRNGVLVCQGKNMCRAGALPVQGLYRDWVPEVRFDSKDDLDLG